MSRRTGTVWLAALTLLLCASGGSARVTALPFDTGSIRFSPGYLTRLEDVERTLDAVRRYARWVASSG